VITFNSLSSVFVITTEILIVNISKPGDSRHNKNRIYLNFHMLLDSVFKNRIFCYVFVRCFGSFGCCCCCLRLMVAKLKVKTHQLACAWMEMTPENCAKMLSLASAPSPLDLQRPFPTPHFVLPSVTVTATATTNTLAKKKRNPF